MAQRIEALKNDTKLGSQFVETHEAAISEAFERLDTTLESSATLDRPLHMVRKCGHHAYDLSQRFGLNRDDLFTRGIAELDLPQTMTPKAFLAGLNIDWPA